jgi:hypothetical protein
MAILIRTVIGRQIQNLFLWAENQDLEDERKVVSFLMQPGWGLSEAATGNRPQTVRRRNGFTERIENDDDLSEPQV